MIWSRGFAALALCGTLFALSGCGEKLGEKFPPYRYKLEVHVETPQGIRKGDSIIEVQWNRGSKALWGSQAKSGYEVTGEAVAVDLPNGETLFVLLRSKEVVDWAAYGAADILADVTTAVGADRNPHPLPRRKNSPFGQNEPINNYPYFVRFKDIQDPKTVEVVDPDDLTKAFGAGYRLKNLTVQITDQAVTTEIEKRLPSYGKETGFEEWYQKLPYGDPRALTLDDFKKGVAK